MSEEAETAETSVSIRGLAEDVASMNRKLDELLDKVERVRKAVNFIGSGPRGITLPAMVAEILDRVRDD